MASDQAAAAESPTLLTRGGAGGGGGEDADSGSGEADPGLSETDPEVWEIINAERRRQVWWCVVVWVYAVPCLSACPMHVCAGGCPERSLVFTRNIIARTHAIYITLLRQQQYRVWVEYSGMRFDLDAIIQRTRYQAV